MPEAPIVEGHHDQGAFNRSAALNLAVRLAPPDWQVAIVIDSDVIIDPARVREAIRLGHEQGKVVYPHDIRKDLHARGTEAVMAGYARSWERFVHKRYPDMVSSVVIVPRRLWDEIGGFDETFRGWGYEDTAFDAAARTFGDGTLRLRGEVWHLWHPTAREGKPGSPEWRLNSTRGARYRAAAGDREAIRALQAERVPHESDSLTIPRILHRVVPETQVPQAEAWWADFGRMHPDWRLMTHRDPLVPAEWPETSPYWQRCLNGAQLADLVRLEALWRWGGVYVDQDVQPLHAFDSLLPVQAFAAWEDERTIPNAILGARPRHPAIRACLDLAVRQAGRDTWKGGPGVTTKVLPWRDDVLVLPPGSLYPVHYRDPDREAKMRDFDLGAHPWTFALHHYWGSWLEPERRRVPVGTAASAGARPKRAPVGGRRLAGARA